MCGALRHSMLCGSEVWKDSTGVMVSSQNLEFRFLCYTPFPPIRSVRNVPLMWRKPPHLMAVLHSWYDLSEEVSGLPLRDLPLVADVVVEIPAAGVLHHDHDFVLVLEYWKTTRAAETDLGNWFRLWNRTCHPNGTSHRFMCKLCL